jgi:hypothetical protein
MEPPDALHEPLFETLGVKPVTTEGSTPGWFLLRGYSFGSSTSDMLLLAIKRHVQQANDPNEDILIAAQPILEYIHSNLTPIIHQEEYGAEQQAASEGEEEGTEVPELAAEDIPEAEYDINDALNDVELNGPEYIQLRVKQLLSLAVDSVEVQLHIEYVGLVNEMDDEVSVE